MRTCGTQVQILCGKFRKSSAQARPGMPLLSLFLLALTCIGSAIGAEPASANEASRALHALFQREWDYAMQENPTRASHLGDRRWNDQWGDVSIVAIERRHQHDKEVLEELSKMTRADLSPADRLNFDLFKQKVEMGVQGHSFRLYLMPISMRGGIQTADELADALRFETVKDFEDWIGRLRRFPDYMAQTISLMREGVRTEIIQPQVIMGRVPDQIEKQIVTEPEKSPFYKPFREMPDVISKSDQERLRKEAQEAIREAVLPNYRLFKEFFVSEYLPACLKEVGAWQLPKGEEAYAFLARFHTSTPLTPQEIHDLGLREVRRIRGEMEKVKERAGFEGTLQEFFEFLRTDERFYCKTQEELLAAYRAVSKRIDPTMVKVFRTLPRMPYGVEAIPDKIAPDTTAAYYRQPAADGSRAGSYFVNLYKPESRPKWEMMALSLHEAVPGHHLQIALAQEQGELPLFRRHGHYTAYIEGWALYAESLGDELGLYDDPYAKFGQLTYEMWRAVRLVVDTGIHQFKWSRERAIEFFRENAPKTEQDIVNEIDRYIGWPGQALAYKVGELKIKELRAEAQRRLGEQFDLRAFHDAVLLAGAMPLDLLEARVREWIDAAEAPKAARSEKASRP